MKNSTRPHETVHWGLALAWYSQYLDGKTSDIRAKIDFLKRYDMTLFIYSYDEIDTAPPRWRDELFEMLEAEAMRVVPHFSCCDITAESDDRKREADRICKQVDAYSQDLRAPLITCTAGNSHRYDRTMPFGEKVQRFSEFLKPISAAAHQAGISIAIENHADYYVSEIIEIIKKVPGIGLLFDTANALHIGEHPHKAAVDAAPYTMGCHFKDHYMVKGATDPLHYEIRGCALGDGDAMLRQSYQEIIENSPYSADLVMLLELFKGEDQGPMECWERSVEFIQSL